MILQQNSFRSRIFFDVSMFSGLSVGAHVQPAPRSHAPFNPLSVLGLDDTDIMIVGGLCDTMLK
jgi:hypothetical protein